MALIVASNPRTAGGEIDLKTGPSFVIAILATVAAWISVFVLGMQWFVASFHLLGEPPEATPEQGTTYLVTAGATVTFALIAVVASSIRFSGLAGRVGLAVAIVTLIATTSLAYALQVPAGRFTFEIGVTDPAPIDEPREPCFGEGPACIGG